MEKSLKNYYKLFLSTFSLSAFTFGGGYVIVSLMKKKFVDDLGWIDEKEMLNIVAIAQSCPGAMAVNASILLGWRMLGFSGAVVAVFGTVLPPLIIISILSFFYNSFKSNLVVNAVLKGMMTGVCAVILDVVITMMLQIFKEKKIVPILIFAGAFVACFILKVNILWIIICAGILGVLFSSHGKKIEKELI